MTTIIHQSDTYIKPRNPYHSGAQAHLARALGYATAVVYDLVRGRINAGPDRAIRLADLTGSPEKIWKPGGTPAQRRAAVENWHERSLASGGPPPPSDATAAGDELPGPPPPA